MRVKSPIRDEESRKRLTIVETIVVDNNRQRDDKNSHKEKRDYDGIRDKKRDDKGLKYIHLWGKEWDIRHEVSSFPVIIQISDINQIAWRINLYFRLSKHTLNFGQNVLGILFNKTESNSFKAKNLAIVQEHQTLYFTP